jgi:hypothetical protein
MPVSQQSEPENLQAPSQLLKYLDLYQQHFDLFVKGSALYYAVVGGVAGYAFSANATPRQRLALIAIVVLGSAVALLGFRACYRWTRDLGAQVHLLEAQLGVVRFPFHGATGVIQAMSLGVAVILLGGIVLALVFVLGDSATGVGSSVGGRN